MSSSSTVALTFAFCSLLGALLAACAGASHPSGTDLPDLPDLPELIGEWTVERIAGAPVVERSPALLTFGEQGRFSGHAGVNQLVGGWSLEAGGLEFSDLATTRMAGPPDLMEQESRLLGALERVTRADLGRSGTLVLRGADGEALVEASRSAAAQ